MASEKTFPEIISLDFRPMNNQEEQESIIDSLFFGMCKCPETPRQREGSMRRNYSDMEENYHRLIDEEDELEGHSVNTKLLMVLEYMRELYVRKIQVLKEMFPGAKDEFFGFFKKVMEAMPQAKSQNDDLMVLRTLSRSRSLGSSENPARLERFKVTTVNPSSGPSVGDGGAGGTAGQGGAADQDGTKK